MPDLTIEKFNTYRADTFMQARNRQNDSELSVHIWGNAEEEYPTMITKLNMPFLYSRRAIVSTYYPKFERKTGAFVTVNSSILNE